jgi:hypothetical protein
MSQNERLMILQMVADKKISTTEAAELLKALEHKKDEPDLYATDETAQTFPPNRPSLPSTPPSFGSGLSAFIEDLVDRVSSTFTTVGDPSYEIPTELTGEFGEGEIPLRISTGNGRVHIRTWDEPGFKATMLVRVKAASEAEARTMAQEAVIVKADAHGFDLEERRQGQWMRNIAVHTTLLVPKGRTYRLDGQTGNGQVELLEIPLQEATFTTGNGRILLRGGISGRVKLRSGNGSVEVEGDILDLDASSGNGSIRLRPTGNRSQSLRLATGNGSIRIQLEQLPTSAGVRLDAQTGMGGINVGVPNLVYERNVSTMGHKALIAQTANFPQAPTQLVIHVRTGLGSIGIE